MNLYELNAKLKFSQTIVQIMAFQILDYFWDKNNSQIFFQNAFLEKGKHCNYLLLFTFICLNKELKENKFSTDNNYNNLLKPWYG
jgi:hypothetical protein